MSVAHTLAAQLATTDAERTVFAEKLTATCNSEGWLRGKPECVSKLIGSDQRVLRKPSADLAVEKECGCYSYGVWVVATLDELFAMQSSEIKSVEMAVRMSTACVVDRWSPDLVSCVTAGPPTGGSTSMEGMRLREEECLAKFPPNAVPGAPAVPSGT
jgi:hypothetical protein